MKLNLTDWDLVNFKFKLYVQTRVIGRIKFDGIITSLAKLANFSVICYYIKL